MEVEWMPIKDTENLEGKLRENAFQAGAAIFARGEGMWHGSGKIYFACTNGGIAKSGQVFTYIPSPHEGTEQESKHPGKLTLYLEPNKHPLAAIRRQPHGVALGRRNPLRRRRRRSIFARHYSRGENLYARPERLLWKIRAMRRLLCAGTLYALCKHSVSGNHISRNRALGKISSTSLRPA